MFGFGKKKSQAESAIAIMPEAIRLAADKWRYFCETLPMKADVPLADRIAMFSVPFFQNLNSRFPVLRKSPDTIHFLIVTKGVELSGTHTKEQIERELGCRLP